jgi:hypothetical protein
MVIRLGLRFMAPGIYFPEVAPYPIKDNTTNQPRDRTHPVGYKVSKLSFTNGEPTDPSTSKTALTDILANPDNSKCPSHCFRPAGAVIDSKGRIFVSSDASGEIFVIQDTKANETSATAASSATGTASATGRAASSSSTKPSGAKALDVGNQALMGVFLAVLAVVYGMWMVMYI